MYSETLEIFYAIGGTKKVSLGTGGTFMIEPVHVTACQTRADALIDYLLSPIYGTRGFGTSSKGTRGLPDPIMYCAIDLSGYYILSDILNPAMANAQELTNRMNLLYARAGTVINQLKDGEMVLDGYEKDNKDGYTPISGDMFVTIYDEGKVLDGTALVVMNYRNVVAYSERAHGTTLDGTLTYTRDVDYKMYYADDSQSGTLRGNIRRLATGSIADGQVVAVDYKIWKVPLFRDYDDRAWGRIDGSLGRYE